MRKNACKIGFLSLLTFLLGCSSPSTDKIVTDFNEEVPFSVNNNREELSKRITYVNRTATITPLVTGVNAKNSANNFINGAKEMNYWEYVAEVAPLQLSGETLSATHITLANNKAYVSYHKQGDTHLGAIEIIDLNNANFPQIITQANFPNADVNAVTSGTVTNASDFRVWAALSHEKNGAVLYEFDTDNDVFNNKYRRVNLTNQLDAEGVSASANGIAVTNDYLYVTSGKTHGGTVQLNKSTLEAMNAESYSNAKYVAVNGSNTGDKVVSLVTGTEARLRVDNVGKDLATTSYDIGEIWHQNVAEAHRGKSTMEFSSIDDSKLYVAKGKDGIALVDIDNGSITNVSKGLMLVAGNTNGVSSDTDYVYAANGSDGISISPHPTSNSENILPIFHWDMAEEGASANYIKANGEWVFVAKGGGGFKILRKRVKDEYKTITTYNRMGKPDGLEEDKVICSTLLNTIYSTVLPERQNAMTNHPEYFTNPVKNLVIKETTDLNLTFIDEGAGYKNVLGYYTYQEGNKPSSPDLVDKVVIFPNASAERSGGELVRGNTMRLLGTFEAGTVVNFFLIANGWRNGKITDGRYTQHSDIDYNLSGRQQSIIFHDSTCNSIVIAFEDISVPNGDNDFNDAIFEITASNPNALEVNTFNQIGGN
ncbi:DUF4114 domain-containing protein [Tenacibaculum sp. 190524A02b]|uniref:DUF4114 domain-containing protein n=1 Tax=Tenacibaculum vairaonense TaxID=3137860 RepID=A0ABM9PP19_9FLAO